MVAVILKSKRSVDDIPSSLIMGIDWLKIKECKSLTDAELLDKSMEAQCRRSGGQHTHFTERR